MSPNSEGGRALVLIKYVEFKIVWKSINISNPLVAIICGYERGGTTLVSEILRQHPSLGSGFEGGFLLCDDPRELKLLEPYVTSLKNSWGVSDQDLDYICGGDGWQDVYGRLLSRSQTVHSELIFDKTPKYMEVLTEVLSRVDVPCIAITRDPRALFYSWAKRSGETIDRWCKYHLEEAIRRYCKYGNGLKNALIAHPDRIHVVQYELLCENPAQEANEIMAFIGLDFDETYIQFANPWRNIYQKSISSSYVAEYRDHFGADVCDKILSKLTEFADWFWNKTD